MDASKGLNLCPPSDNIEEEQVQDEKRTFKFRVCKNLQLSVYKPMIPLKLTQFFYYGAHLCYRPFIAVHFKQLGMTIGELSFLYALLPVVQMLTSTLSSLIADKTGKPRAVLLANIAIAVTLLVGIIFLPPMEIPECDRFNIEVRCPRHKINEFIAMCDTDRSLPETQIESPLISEISAHTVRKSGMPFEACSENRTVSTNNGLNTSGYLYGVESSFICEFLDSKQPDNSSSIYFITSNAPQSECFSNDQMSGNPVFSLCMDQNERNCSVVCKDLTRCSARISYRTRWHIMASVLFIFFVTTYSNCFRFIDVTAMSMVKAHGKDFGRERISGILGFLCFSLLSGFILSVSPWQGANTNYLILFYMAVALKLLSMAAICKLDVHLNTPAKTIWKEYLELLKNPHNAVFALVLLWQGAVFAFNKHFMSLYLNELGAPNYLLSLVWGIGDLYGLPFLFTSKWFVRKIGCLNIMLLAFVGYVVQCFGMASLQHAWLVLALESMDVLTYHLQWVAVVTHSYATAPTGLTATAIGTAGSIHYGLGKGVGSLVGGQVMSAYGGSAAFKVLGCLSLVSGLLFFLYLNIVRILNNRKITKSNESRAENDDARDCEEIVELHVKTINEHA